jgi:hypothetical protein
MKPDPVRQRKATHKQRQALGRAMHLVQMFRKPFLEQSIGKEVRLKVTKPMRSHEGLLRALVFAGAKSKR